MHDARWFEAANKPAVALVSSEFRNQAQYQAQTLNATHVPQVFVQHPISDQTTAQLYAKADAVVDQVVACLSAPWTPLKEAEVAKEAEAECGT